MPECIGITLPYIEVNLPDWDINKNDPEDNLHKFFTLELSTSNLRDFQRTHRDFAEYESELQYYRSRDQNNTKANALLLKDVETYLLYSSGLVAYPQELIDKVKVLADDFVSGGLEGAYYYVHLQEVYCKLVQLFKLHKKVSNGS